MHNPAACDLLPALQLLSVVNVDAVFVGRVLSRALHILSAIIIGGGLFYLQVVFSRDGAEAWFGTRREVWARWVAIASLLLIVSGLINLMAIIIDARAAGEKLPKAYHILFGVKLLLGLLVMFIASILAGKTAAADRFRAKSRLWLNVAWTAVVAIVLIGAVLRMLHGRTPSDDAAPPPSSEASDGQES